MTTSTVLEELIDPIASGQRRSWEDLSLPRISLTRDRGERVGTAHRRWQNSSTCRLKGYVSYLHTRSYGLHCTLTVFILPSLSTRQPPPGLHQGHLPLGCSAVGWGHRAACYWHTSGELFQRLRGTVGSRSRPCLILWHTYLEDLGQTLPLISWIKIYVKALGTLEDWVWSLRRIGLNARYWGNLLLHYTFSVL